MKILLFCSAFNGLSQRAWIALRALGHDVTVHLSPDATPIERVCRDLNPDLIICPFLKDRVPESVWRHHRTIIIHPGPMGDRGPSSLDWAIAEGADTWGVTALQAAEEMDAGPIWATRTFSMPQEPVRKGSLYNGPVADAAIDMLAEVVAKAADPAFSPEPLDYDRADVIGRLRSTMTQADRCFDWEDPTDKILRNVRAGDGSPGVRTVIAGQELSVFDAHRGPSFRGHPGTIVGVRNGAVLVATGDGSLWIGQAKRRGAHSQPPIKLPAARVLWDRLDGAPTVLSGATTGIADPDCASGGGLDLSGQEMTYHREGPVGVLSFNFYNGAMSAGHCRRLEAALRRAISQDTRVLVLRGGDTFSNGIDLNTVEAARNPAGEAWANINAIDDVCRAIITCTDQLVVASVGSNAGAGGVMLALGADLVTVRDSVVLNPHYKTMGLFGSEYWTYTLPRRVGAERARELTEACLPIGAHHAAGIGLADQVIGGSRDQFETAVLDQALRLATSAGFGRTIKEKQRRRQLDEIEKPLDAYRNEELGQMSRDMFDDRSGFGKARHAFVLKQKPEQTPAHLVAA